MRAGGPRRRGRGEQVLSEEIIDVTSLVWGESVTSLEVS